MRIDSVLNIQLWEDNGIHYPLDKEYRETAGIVIHATEKPALLIIDGHRTTVRDGDVQIYPKGSKYRVELLENYVSCYVINFDGDCGDEIITLRGCQALRGQFETAERLWRQHREDKFFRLDCLSIAYSILAELMRRREATAVPLRKRDSISPIIERIHECYSQPEFRISQLAEEFGMSERSLCRAFSEVLGVSPKHYLNELRITRAKELLSSGIGEVELSVTAIAHMVGFRDIYHFSSYFRSKTGITPSEYRASF